MKIKEYSCPNCDTLNYIDFTKDSLMICQECSWQENRKIGKIDGSVIWVDEVENIGECWHRVNKLYVGKSKTPNKYYLVYKDRNPYLLVGVFHEYEPIFPVFTLWRNYLLLGMCDDFCHINLLTLEKGIFPSNGNENKFGYFCKFHKLDDHLLVASESELYCFDNNLAKMWQTGVIACDGVLVHGYEDEYLCVHGENDPPGGWIAYKIEFATGKIIDKEWAVDENYEGLLKDFEEYPEYMAEQFRKLRNGNDE